ncbi:MAG: hypothetical protein C4K58_03295 [Flavobacteriaceae bacterium]|nr:MAG: hypothetical protein C4K58_03295 [Flavobacteriaceae bacterium]
MFVEDFFQAVPPSLQENYQSRGRFSLDIGFEFPKLEEGLCVVVMGFQPDRNPDNFAFSAFRESLYELKKGTGFPKIFDVGNFVLGDNPSDTLFALNQVFGFFKNLPCKLWILGASIDAVSAFYQSFERPLHLVDFNVKFALEDHNESLVTSNYLSHFIAHPPYNLYRYTLLGYQTHYVAQEELDLMENLNFEFCRLGLLKEEMPSMETYFRTSDFCLFHLNMLEASCFSSTYNLEPNGLNSNQVCQLTRYLGSSQKNKAFFALGYFPQKDLSGVDAKTLSQMFWYYLDGFKLQSASPTESTMENFTKLIVPQKGDQIEFLHDPIHEKWWIIGVNFNQKIEFEPCTYKDYLDIVEGNLPSRWWKLQKRLAGNQ